MVILLVSIFAVSLRHLKSRRWGLLVWVTNLAFAERLFRPLFAVIPTCQVVRLFSKVYLSFQSWGHFVLLWKCGVISGLGSVRKQYNFWIRSHSAQSWIGTGGVMPDRQASC